MENSGTPENTPEHLKAPGSTRGRLNTPENTPASIPRYSQAFPGVLRCHRVFSGAEAWRHGTPAQGAGCATPASTPPRRAPAAPPALCPVRCAVSLTCSSLAPRRTRTHTPASSLPGRATPRACTALPMCWPAPQAELENVSEIVCPEGHAWCVDVKEAAGDEEKRGVWIDPNESTPLSGRYVRRTSRADGPA